MSSLVSRSLILAVARLLNQGLMMLSPILLVRLLDVIEYGRYRQFTVTSTFVTALAEFSIVGSVSYFVAKEPQESSRVITNSCLLLLGTSLIAAVTVVAGQKVLVPSEISQYTYLLVAYILLYLNLDIVVSYWLAQRRSDLVLLYSVSLILLRLAAVTGAAAYFGDVGKVFTAMVVAEAIKLLWLYAFLRRQRLLEFSSIDRHTLRDQLQFIVPTGSGSLLYKVNENIGKILVSSLLGPIQLAIFTIAAYQVPVLSVLKSALSEAIFPDMVQRSKEDARLGLRLWQKTNVIYFLFVGPAWVLLTYFSEPLIRLLFTEAYIGATPYFQWMLLLMLRQCFDFSTPLRSVGNTRPFVMANVVGLIINVGLSLLLIPSMGLMGPVIAILLTQGWLMIFLARTVRIAFGISASELLEWRKLMQLVVANAIAFVAMLVVWHVGKLSLLAGVGAVVCFGAVYLATVWLCHIEEFVYVAAGIRQHLNRRVVR